MEGPAPLPGVKAEPPGDALREGKKAVPGNTFSPALQKGHNAAGLTTSRPAKDGPCQMPLGTPSARVCSTSWPLWCWLQLCWFLP